MEKLELVVAPLLSSSHAVNPMQANDATDKAMTNLYILFIIQSLYWLYCNNNIADNNSR